jgi:hypothetical protein
MEKIGRNCKKLKKHRNKMKRNTTKHQNKNRDGGGGGRGKGMGGTSSKLLEPGVKGTWGGWMASPTIMAFWEGGWQLVETKKP